MILIMGATGRIGQHVVRQLHKMNVPFKAMVRNAEKGAWIKAMGIEVVMGDMGNSEELNRILQGIEKVFLVSKEHPQQVDLQRNVIEASKYKGVKHIVKISAIGAEFDSPMVVGRWHAQSEQDLRDSGIAFTFLRPNFFMQNMSLYRKSLMNESRFYAPMGKTKVAFVDAKDIAAVATAALTQGGHEEKVYEVSGPEAVNYDQIAQKFSQAFNKPITYVDISNDNAREELLSLGLPPWHADSIVEDYQFFKDGHGTEVTDTVPRIAGRPASTFDQFIREYVASIIA